MWKLVRKPGKGFAPSLLRPWVGIDGDTTGADVEAKRMHHSLITYANHLKGTLEINILKTLELVICSHSLTLGRPLIHHRCGNGRLQLYEQPYRRKCHSARSRMSFIL